MSDEDKKDLTNGEKIAVDVMRYFSQNTDNSSGMASELQKLDSRIGQRIDKGMNIFFEIEDKYNLSKTDIEQDVIFPISQLIDFVRNPAPVYNAYIDSISLKDFREEGFTFKHELIDEENIEALRESLKIRCPELVNLIVDIYIPALVSRDRMGRKEGKAVMHGLTELTKMINEKIFGMEGGMYQNMEVDK